MVTCEWSGKPTKPKKPKTQINGVVCGSTCTLNNYRGNNTSLNCEDHSSGQSLITLCDQAGMEDTQADMYVTENVLLFNKAHPFSLAGQLRSTLQNQGYTHTHTGPCLQPTMAVRLTESDISQPTSKKTPKLVRCSEMEGVENSFFH